MATTPGYVLARRLPVADKARIFPYDKLNRMVAIGRTRKVHHPRRPFIRSKNNVTGKAEYPDYVLAAFADVENIR
jgi:hypothetical protein